MAVDPKFRGEGYGRALMEHAIKEARSAGATALYLLTNTRLEPAISLYEQFGFAPTLTGQHPVYTRCNLVMERTL
jgi:GNAT superfamily N-acetyltransferase